jgi:hypothetical protein
VRADAAREDVLPARVDHPVGRDVERPADQADALALDEHVADVASAAVTTRPPYINTDISLPS